MLDRRKFLNEARKWGGAAMLGGMVLGGRMVQQAHARTHFKEKLLELSDPVLLDKAEKELAVIPQRSREEIRQFFHGVCLNVNRFVEEIYSSQFLNRLKACRSQKEQHRHLNLAFDRTLVSGEEVVYRVKVLAKESGTLLDMNWQGSCEAIGQIWGKEDSLFPSQETTPNYADRWAPWIINAIDQAKASTYPVGQHPTLKGTVGQIGYSAIKLLPLAVVAPEVIMPVFLITALFPVYEYIIALVENRKLQSKEVLSKKLSLLGNRIGMEFEREIIKRISDLHIWQSEAIRNDVEIQSKNNVHWIF